MTNPKPNQFKLFQPAIPIDKQSKGESGEIEIKLERPRLRLQYKDNSLSLDHIPLYRIFSNDEEITSNHSKSNPQGNNPPPNGTNSHLFDIIQQMTQTKNGKTLCFAT